MPPARFIVALSLAAVCAAFVAGAAQSTPVGAVDLLTEANVKLDGVAGTAAGTSVSDAGDVNGDGRADVIVGAPQADNNMRTNSGSAYVVFGSASPTTVDLGALVGGGFRIDGQDADDRAGDAVAGAGDLNGDNLADVIVGAPQADNNGRALSGSAYVVYGSLSPTNVDLAALGSGGFRIDGAATQDLAGIAVSGAGDVNGDGQRDVLVGAHNADNNVRSNSGSAYVVFGSASPTTVDLGALGGGGFRIDGAAALDLAAESASGAGDVNGDAKADVIVGAKGTDAAYVVFGKSIDTDPVDLADLGTVGNTEGFRMDGAAASTLAGDSVAGVGDLNGDARAEVVVGAPWADDNARQDSGSAYVIFGKITPDTIDLSALGGGGYRIEGAAAFGFAGGDVAGAGDVNADGLVDLLVGASNESRNGRAASGSAYVVFGKSSTTAVDLNALGTNGFRIDGAAASDLSGFSVAGAGNFNGDSRPDVLVGAQSEGADDSGAAYIVFGFGPSQLAYNPLSGTVGQAIAPHAPTQFQSTGTRSFQVAPALPAGLVLDGSTGVVTGTPTVAQAQTTHAVTMTDLAGQTTAPLVVTVAAAPLPPPPPPPGPPPADRTPPGLNLFITSPQRALKKKRIVVHASCNEPCMLKAEGAIVFRGISALINLSPASSNQASKSKRALTLKLSKGGQRRLARYFAKGRRAKAIVSIRARDAAGNARSRSRGITVRR